MAIMNAGRIEQLGRPEEVYREPRSAYVAGFIGETNLIKGRVLEVRDGFVMADTELGALVGRCTDPEWEPKGGEEVVLSVRPEAWSIGSSTGGNRIEGKISDRSYLGQCIQYEVATAVGNQHVVELNPLRIYEAGETVVHLSARHADVVVLKG
jgi:ABC-type Fe3+/spermidine/putrescine transport system ATPase subunit